MKIRKGYRFKLVLTLLQEAILTHWINAVNLIWNLCLKQRELAYSSVNRRSISGVDQMGRELTAFKKENEWTYEIPSQLFQQKISDLQSAFERFWDGTSEYPDFKRKRDKSGSVRFPTPSSIGLNEGEVPLEFTKEVTKIELDMAKIEASIASGQKIPGVAIETNKSLLSYSNTKGK